MNAAGSSSTPLADRVEDCLAAQVRPFLKVHGGDCELVSVDGGTVTIRFLMACTGCRLRPLTLLAGVRPRLLAIDGVTDIAAVGVGVSAAAVRRVDRALATSTP